MAVESELQGLNRFWIYGLMGWVFLFVGLDYTWVWRMKIMDMAFVISGLSYWVLYSNFMEWARVFWAAGVIWANDLIGLITTILGRF